MAIKKGTKYLKMPEVKYRRLRRYQERLLKMKPLIRLLNRYIDRGV
jgi:hypothetical protein